MDRLGRVCDLDIWKRVTYNSINGERKPDRNFLQELSDSLQCLSDIVITNAGFNLRI